MPLPTSRLRFGLIAVPAAIIISLTGCSAIGQVTDLVEGKSDVFTLAVGDCFNDEAGEVITSVKVLKCTEPHDNELYYEYSLPNDFFGSESYSQDKIYTDAEEKCFPEFESFIGSSFDDTALNFSYLFPTEESWGEHDRSIQCMVYSETGQISESLKGKGPSYPLE